MTDAEVFGFMETFRGVTRVFPLRGEAHEIQDVGKSYFKALRRFTLPQVRDAADRCLAECKHFPKPAEWAERITRRIPVEIPELSAQDARDWLTAERLRWEDEPCRCALCQSAGVTHRFLRFVPEADEDGRDRHARIGERVVTRGHWAHGEELARWYDAKERFFGQFGAALKQKTMSRPKQTFQQRLDAIYAQKTQIVPPTEPA